MRRIVVRGVGDVGSAVAHRLFAAGYAVAIHDDPQPTTSRRVNAFTDVVFDWYATLAGVTALRVADPRGLAELLDAHQAIPVFVGDLGGMLAAISPAVLVDARMRKRANPEPQRGLAALVIGLGPGFVAGHERDANADIAIETSWSDLGRIITSGPTMPLEGEPRPLGGHSRDRFIYAPIAGIFRTECRIGDRVEAGQEVARIVITGVGEGATKTDATLDATSLLAPLGGTLRGLTHDGVPVAVGTKVIEVDPRGGPVAGGIGERPGKITDGVLAALVRT